MGELIFLEEMLKAAKYPYHFTNTKQFNKDEIIRNTDAIEIGRLAGYELPQLNFIADPELNKIDLVDMRKAQRRDKGAVNGDKIKGLSATECMAIIERYFEAL